MAMLLHHSKKLKYRIDVTRSGGLLTKKETIFKVTTVKFLFAELAKKSIKEGKQNKKMAWVLEFHTCE